MHELSPLGATIVGLAAAVIGALMLKYGSALSKFIERMNGRPSILMEYEPLSFWIVGAMWLILGALFTIIGLVQILVGDT